MEHIHDDGDGEFICEECEAIIQEMVAEGYLRDSGRRRNGQIVWVSTRLLEDEDDTGEPLYQLTEKGKTAHPDGMDPDRIILPLEVMKRCGPMTDRNLDDLCDELIRLCGSAEAAVTRIKSAPPDVQLFELRGGDA